MKKGFKFEAGFSEEHKRKIAESLRGKKKSPEHCAAISKAKVGISPDLSSRRSYAGESNPFFGKGHSKESREKIGAATTERRWKRFQKYGVSEEQYNSNLAVGLKWCCIHKQFLQAGEFFSRQTMCNQCARNILLKRKYGVSADWYDAKCAEQHGVCAICDSPPMSRKKFLDVDHSHKTKEVRGLLCGRCNTAIERVDSVPDWIARVQLYLNRE